MTNFKYSSLDYGCLIYSLLLQLFNTIIGLVDSTRMLFATWWIFILILTSFYTANLTAFLTKPQFTLSISSLQDIVKKGYSWVTYEGRTIDFLLSQVRGIFLSVCWIIFFNNIKKLWRTTRHFPRTIKTNWVYWTQPKRLKILNTTSPRKIFYN